MPLSSFLSISNRDPLLSDAIANLDKKVSKKGPAQVYWPETWKQIFLPFSIQPIVKNDL
jgi:hypothetical protein